MARAGAVRDRALNPHVLQNMTYRRDPELNRLVNELNRAAENEPPATPSRHSPDVAGDTPLDVLLQEAIAREASDLILVPGVVPTLRIHGSLVPSGSAQVSADEIRQMFAPALSPAMLEEFETRGATDFSLRVESSKGVWRFRVNLHRQRSESAASLRVLPPEIPPLEHLGLPPAVRQTIDTTRGLILICGPTGSGKSTTLAALVDVINNERAHHVVTIEDPIEYEHTNRGSLIEQIEIRRDAPDFASALRSVLRQNPDVILLGEMRDHDTISTALTAAETGHLILSTLHTSSAAQAIHRIVDAFPASQQAQIRSQLALAIHAIICQQLIPRKDGAGRVLAVEVLLATNAVRNHIRRDTLQHIHSEITLGKRQGMLTLEDSLAGLVASGTIDLDEARLRANRPDELESLMR